MNTALHNKTGKTPENSTLKVELPYLKPVKEEPISHAGYPELEKPHYDMRTVDMADARTIDSSNPLKTHGFAAIPHKSAIGTFDESTSWHQQFCKEVELLIKTITGASEVIVPLATTSYRCASFTGSVGPASFCLNAFNSIGVVQHIANLDPAKADQ